MQKKVSASFIIILGSMLFALFFGAGNLIFPPMLGQLAGENVWSANAGFLITGVGLPLVAVAAFVYSGKSDLQSLASRVHPLFGLVFTVVLYLAIGPFFAMPRTGSVSFEIGVKPLLPESGSHHLALAIFTILFFGLACVLSLNPSRIIDVIGRVLTPIKLTFIGVLVVTALVYPIAKFQAPDASYASHAFFKGFQEGYLTLDALAATIFGIIIVNALKDRGVTARGELMSICARAIAVAAVLLAVIYSSLSYMGAASVGKLGVLGNGADVLAKVSAYYFGPYGSVLLGLMITVACMTTSVGLITSCAAYFHGLFPKLSYKKIAVILAAFSALVANVGLNGLIRFSAPVLMMLYPLAIALVILTFLHPLFKGNPGVYRGALLLTFIVSLFDGLKAGGIEIAAAENVFSSILPLYGVGLGWLVPAVIGGLAGLLLGKPAVDETPSLEEVSAPQTLHADRALPLARVKETQTVRAAAPAAKRDKGV
ncbi:branched-chain amino acid transport system II carrier protein [Saccharibacillus sp. CPCC 101409]|uniref:branched-chain amino acid transport system II carrier protein n=1 Tax=Saccharibacillus sp. CPCC 101409 TaxID=3058041 RepID=UPI0026723FF3|nr:branched-chain amino acid transport system II carrier protein [Saccharibacillus sp. CPCC 101409]MDO3411606.1 branched-chain amino acid transport system II carrier protein [Saccharibacillus sp. CPCC 101409]